MKFCIQCNNMYYLRIPEDNQNQLKYYCRHCGYEDEMHSNEGVCITKTDFQDDEQSFHHIVNPYTKMDPTLPRIYHMKCPNETCKTNDASDSTKSQENAQTEIIYMRYDDNNLKYLYICPTCDTNWTSK